MVGYRGGDTVLGAGGGGEGRVVIGEGIDPKWESWDAHERCLMFDFFFFVFFYVEDTKKNKSTFKI